MKKTSFPKSQIKIVLLENIHPAAVESFKQEGYDVHTYAKALNKKELIEATSDAHVLGIRSKTQVPDEFFKSASRLLSIGCFCIGTDQVHLKSARSHGVPVFNAPYSNTRSVAELVIAEIVMLSRKAAYRSHLLHQGRWEKSAKDCHEVREKTLGIIGYGHIGSQVSVLAESFGMKVLYHDLIKKMPLGNSHQVGSLDQLLKISDYVTIHVPDTPLTQNLLGANEMKQMKKGAHLINASRGSVVDLSALKSALLEGHLHGAALDVFPSEPESNDETFESELQNIPNVILTPHIGGSTEEAQKNIGYEVASSLHRFIDNGTTTGAVNFPQVELPSFEGAHRILNVHKNVPGVLKQITGILTDLGANIQGQYLSTDPEIGYLIVDLDKELSETARLEIRKLDAHIKSRVLY